MHAASDVEILSAAFADDPLFGALFARPAAALPEWFAGVLDVLAPCSFARVERCESAVAVWSTRTCPHCLPELEERLTAVLTRWSGAGAFDLAQAAHDAAVPVPADAWFLHWIGSTQARRGHGRKLLTAIVAEARAAGAGVWTTTTNPAAVEFYVDSGMSTIATRPVCGSRLTCWTLRSGGD
jgi:GNAT superfamily N-acetyltransferase